MNTSHERISANTVILSLLVLVVIAGIVMAALAFDALLWLIGGIIVLGCISVALARVGVNLFSRWTDARIKVRSLDYEHDEHMAKLGYLPSDDRYLPTSRQIAAPVEPKPEQKQTIDPRHALLVNLCLLTIKSAAYGPTSKRLMTADDAQADRSGLFADRMQWDAASKYGQDCKYLYTQRGGNPDEQGLKIKCPNGNTAADLLVELHSKNLILDSAINALPGIAR